jgi:hypothetical protein
MSAVIDKPTSPGNRGSHYTRGSDFMFYVNELSPQIFRQPVNPATMIVQQVPKALISLQQHNLNANSGPDLRWTGGTAKKLEALSNGKIMKLSGSFTSLDQISPETLAGIAWGSISANNSELNEDGQSTTGNFYAVWIPFTGGDAQYAKVRIFKDTTTKIEWVTYVVGTTPIKLHTLTENLAPRDVVMSEFESDIYVSGGVGAEGYVVKFQRIIGGPFPQYTNTGVPLTVLGSAAPVLSPQQMVVDGNSIYVVAEGGLFLLQPESYTQVQVVSGIANPIGLLLDKQKSTTVAYISDQAGQVYVVDISQFTAPTFDEATGTQSGFVDAIPAPSPTPGLALGGPSGFLTWADDAHTAFYAPVVGATGKIQRVDIVASSATAELTAADPTLANPWSVAVFAEGSVSAVCDSAIYDIERGLVVTAELALGLGLIPFDFITNSKINPVTPAPLDGRVTTPPTPAPGYYFSSTPNLAFGGQLSLLINHPAAWNSGLRYYKLSITNDTTGVKRDITGTFTDLRWNSMASPPRFEARNADVQGGFFPVRSPSELWYNPFLAALINTALSDNGYNRLKLDFYTSKTAASSASYTRLIYVDNTRTSVTLNYMRRGTSTTAPAPSNYVAPEACGLIPYDSKDDLIEIDLTAVHPGGLGKYYLSFSRGSTGLFTVTGDLTSSTTLLTVKERSPGVPLRVGHLTGNCDIANVGISLNAPTPGVINGFGWVNLGSSAYRSFTLAKPPLTHTNWPMALQAGMAGPAIVMGAPIGK